MSEERSDPPPLSPPQDVPPPVPPAQPLDYAPPPHPLTGSNAVVMGCLGVVVSLVAAFFLGVFFFNLIGAGIDQPMPHWRWPMLVWAAVLVGASYGAVKSKASGRFRPFLLGLFITMAVMALLEGICFSSGM